jgi:hypothetical protein
MIKYIRHRTKSAFSFKNKGNWKLDGKLKSEISFVLANPDISFELEREFSTNKERIEDMLLQYKRKRRLAPLANSFSSGDVHAEKGVRPEAKTNTTYGPNNFRNISNVYSDMLSDSDKNLLK